MNNVNNVKVAIGKNYRPSRFEHRDSHGTYSALRPEITSNGSALQAALLKPRPRPVSALILGALCGAIGIPQPRS